MENTFAATSWCAEDVLTLAPDMTVEQAEDFLAENEKYILEAMIQAGWNVIEWSLPEHE